MIRSSTDTRIVSLLVSLFDDDVAEVFHVKHLRHEQRSEQPEVKRSSYLELPAVKQVTQVSRASCTGRPRRIWCHQRLSVQALYLMTRSENVLHGQLQASDRPPFAERETRSRRIEGASNVNPLDQTHVCKRSSLSFWLPGFDFVRCQ